MIANALLIQRPTVPNSIVVELDNEVMSQMVQLFKLYKFRSKITIKPLDGYVSAVTSNPNTMESWAQQLPSAILFPDPRMSPASFQRAILPPGTSLYFRVFYRNLDRKL